MLIYTEQVHEWASKAFPAVKWPGHVKIYFVHDVSHIQKILQLHQNPNALPKMQFIFKEHSINEHNILYALSV